MDETLKEKIIHLWHEGRACWSIAAQCGAKESDVVDIVIKEQEKTARNQAIHWPPNVEITGGALAPSSDRRERG